jgi:acetyl esterase/lipase
MREKFLKFILAVLIYLCLVASSAQAASQNATSTTSPLRDEKPAAPPLVYNPATRSVEQFDVTYCNMPGSTPETTVAVKMDLLFPNRAKRPAPAVVYIHGGGWTHGDKSGSRDRMDLTRLRQRGFLIVLLNYRLAPEFKFPAMIEDVKCAMRHLRANAALYHLDPQRIGVMGESAGGHLSALLGTTSNADLWDNVGGYTDQSSAVQAVVDLYGPADLPAFPHTPGNLATMVEVFGVDDPADPFLVVASPAAHVTSDAAPMMMIHGDKDSLVPVAQSRILRSRMWAAHAPSTLIVVLNAEHGFAPVGAPINPTQQQIIQYTVGFFENFLKGNNGKQ